jgi:eukaryotic-like serine/threonine-protein kinase
MRTGDLIAGRFEIERLASSGGMGAVYRAIDRRTAQPVALKSLHRPDIGLDRFEREAEVLAELEHPGIVRYVAHGRDDDGQGWLAIEWLEGEDLGAHLARIEGKRLGIGAAVALAQRAAEALGAAHARGVIHRDVKPQNLFLVGGQALDVRVLDFGIARLTVGHRVDTGTGVTVGTPGYMAPEQARGARDVDARADVFALGCVLFECLTGRAVFLAEHVMGILAKVLLEEAPRLQELGLDVPDALDDLVARMLSKDRDARPADGAAAARELAAVSGPASLATPSSRRSLPPGLTIGEKRLLSLVLADARSLGATDTDAPRLPPLGEAFAATLTTEDAAATAAQVRRELATFGARVESLLDGSVIATLTSTGSATDQAAQAARFALAMRGLLPTIPMALATGRGWAAADRVPVGEVIDRAVRLLGDDAELEPQKARVDPPAQRPLRLGFAPLAFAAPIALGGGIRLGASSRPMPVRVDDVTAGLLDVRFEVSGDARGLTLAAEREGGEITRTLLGKPTPFVGREREMAVLLGRVDECVTEPVARAVLITAPAGAGKSRIRFELLRAVRERGEAIEIWVSRGDPMSAGSPFGMIAPMIRRAAGIFEGEPLGVRRQKLRARVGRHIAGGEAARVAEFLGELASAPFPAEDSVELFAARADAMLMGDQMRRAWETFLAAECAARPLVLVLEDLHWGDLPSVQFVDAALRRLDGAPFFVLALGRPEVREIFPRLWEDRAVDEIRLPDLSKRAGEKLARAVLGEGVSATAVERVVAQSAGNAFYLEELIRAVAAGKGDHLPETVLAMVEGRLERLDPAERRVLRAASVLGQVAWRDGILALLGGHAAVSELDAALARIVESEFLARRPESRFPDQIEYVFRQAIVREAAYATLTEADRVLGHQLAASWLERAGETEAVVLAEHLERGGRPEQATEKWLRAAAQALEGNDLAAALARADRGVASGAAGEILGELRLIQAEALRWRNENAEAERCAREAMDLFPRSHPSWYAAASERANVAGKLGHLAELAAIAELLLDEPPGQGPSRDVGALHQAAIQLVHAGRYPLAQALLDRMADEAASRPEVARDPRAAMRLHQARAAWASARSDAAVYRHETEASIELAERVGDLRTACLQRSNLGDAYMQLGGFAEAERALREALDGAARLGLDFVDTVARLNLGLALACQGRIDEACAALREAIERNREKGDRRVEVGARLYLAIASSLAADFAEAERQARLAIDAAAHAPLMTYGRAILARVLLAQDRSADALAAAQEAKAVLDRLGELEVGESLVRLVHAETLFAVGDRPGAFAAIFEARVSLLARAEKITDPVWRESFLHRVPDNAATLARARQWLGTA